MLMLPFRPRTLVSRIAMAVLAAAMVVGGLYLFHVRDVVWESEQPMSASDRRPNPRDPDFGARSVSRDYTRTVSGSLNYAGWALIGGAVFFAGCAVFPSKAAQG